MNILHIGNFKLGTENGSYNALWSLACAQAASGHDVTILRMGKYPSKEHKKIAEEYGVRLVGYSCLKWYGFWNYKDGLLDILGKIEPDIVHLQYVRIPKYLAVARALISTKIPYVISLHGGLNSTEMSRRKYRKMLYWWLIEKYVHTNSFGLHFVTTKEMSDYSYLNSVYRGKKVAIYNAVEPQNHRIKQNYDLCKPLSFVYLGRYDIWTKGLDLVFEFISRLDELNVDVELHLYGRPGNKYKQQFWNLCNIYANLVIIDHGFVGGEEKFKALSKYDFYIQYSRFELFGMSIVEALCSGTPTLISENCDISSDLLDHSAAICLPMDPRCAADQFNSELIGKSDFSEMGKNGREWCISSCSPENVDTQMHEFYEAVINDY